MSFLHPELEWHLRFLRVAAEIASWSKDPSTKVGAVIVRDRKILATGYNGFPRGFPDTPELYQDRSKKYERVVHAEANAIVNSDVSLHGATLYNWPLFTCNECAKLVIQAGIKLVVAPSPAEDRWAAHFEIARELYTGCSVQVLRIDNRDDLTRVMS